MHAGAPLRRDHGVVRGRMRRLLPLSPRAARADARRGAVKGADLMAPNFDAATCPIPLSAHTHVMIGHGGGGQLTNTLIEQVFLPAFRNDALSERHDGARVDIGNVTLAFTTDSYVVRPLVFPGGDIGTLAVNGTVNDLAMCGARPLYLSVGLILEEGFGVADLQRIVASMAAAAQA